MVFFSVRGGRDTYSSGWGTGTAHISLQGILRTISSCQVVAYPPVKYHFFFTLLQLIFAILVQNYDAILSNERDKTE